MNTDPKKIMFMGNTDGNNTPQNKAGHDKHAEALVNNLTKQESEGQSYKEEKLEDYKDFDFIPLGQRVTIVVGGIDRKINGRIIADDAWTKIRNKQIFEQMKNNPYLMIVRISPNLDKNAYLEEGDRVRLDAEVMSLPFERPEYPNAVFMNVDIFQIQGKLKKKNNEEQ